MTTTSTIKPPKRRKPGPKPGSGAPRASQQLRGTWRSKAEAKAAQQPLPPVRRKAPVPTAATLELRCRTLIPGYDPWHDSKGWHFDAARARKAVAFFHRELTHVKGEKAGKPFALEPWQQALIGNIFGWINARGLRRYREVFLFVPRKNGKTALAAGIILYLLFEDGEPCAEIYGAASEFGQASMVFEHARGMVFNNKRLRDRSKITSGQSGRTIQLPEDWSTYKVIASNALSTHGYNTHGAVIDELHAMPNRELVDVLQTSTGARRQPLIVHITTSDFEREGSICNEKHGYAGKVRDKIISNPKFLPVIYEATKDDDWHDEAVWAKANPNLGVSFDIEYLRTEYQRALDVPGFEDAFKRLHENMRTQCSSAWLTPESWAACGEKPVDLEALRGQKCWGGLDLATMSDLTAFALVFPDGEGAFDVLVWFWMPEANIEKRERSLERSRGSYREWVRDGHIRTTEGNVTDYAFVRRDINEIADRYAVQEIAVDRDFQGVYLCTQLMDDGFEIVTFGQGFRSMNLPTKMLEDLVVSHRIHHGCNPVLRWMVSNVTTKTDEAGCIKPDRKRSTDKIDGVVATIMALGRAPASPVDADRPLMAIV